MNAIEIQALARAAGTDVRTAVRGWRAGVPRYEIALLNRLTQQLGRHRRGCRVGHRRFRVVPTMSVTHASASDNTDMFGSDLAVTLSVPVDGYLKTALFQLKRAKGSKAQLQRSQLEDALKLPETADRSFVFAADEKSGEVKIASVADLLASLPDGVASPTCDLNDPEWFDLDTWLFAWIECSVGAGSDPSGGEIEHILECAFGEYVAPEGVGDRGQVGELIDEMWLDWNVARAWLRLKLMPQDEEGSA